jgi:predicted membrane channel-forming protein YqfA (hemolysin III family)
VSATPIALPLRCYEVDAPYPPPEPLSGGLTFTIRQRIATSPSVGLVRRFATPVLQTFGLTADKEKCDRGDDPENDQYTIGKSQSMCWGVLVSNNTGRLHPRSLLGNYGHVERLASWIHLVGAVLFGIYALLRPFVITKEHTTAEFWATVAAASVAFCFGSSTVYHITAPSQSLAYWTRQLDYIAIYVAIALGGLADFAIATRGFANTAFLSIIDGPLAAVMVSVFFLMRRVLTPSNESWSGWLGGCTLSLGLFRRGHTDGTHTGARQATSFILAIAYFVTIPSVIANFGAQNGVTIIAIEVLALAVIVAGMTLDNAYTFPDAQLAKGKGPRFLVCKSCGCVGTSHALWHALSVVAALKASAAREFALSLQR